MTGRYQPLGIRVFGCLKATARQVFWERGARGPNEPRTMQSAVKALVWAWEHLSIDVIEDARKIYTGRDDDE
jgi:hypothetical protein